MQKNKDISDSQHSSSAGVQRLADGSIRSPLSNSKSQLRRRQVTKEKTIKTLGISGKQSDSTTKRFSDRTKIHFTSCYYKNINLIQLKANIGNMTGV